jgi:hypothetical protein
MSRDSSELGYVKIGDLRKTDNVGRTLLDAEPHESRSAPVPRSLPDDVWDVFRLDESEVADEPEPGDFWLEPDELEEP